MSRIAGLMLLILLALPARGQPPGDDAESIVASRTEGSSHWAFQPVAAQRPPPDPSGWSENPIDGFIAAAWRERGIEPVPPANRHTLLRRASFDLVGLPPTPTEVAAFVADEAPDAFARQIDRLLASPRYGERWARHWMDVVRYADTAGDNADYPIPEARLYRDYIIDSFNEDKPYGQFVQEQLAGDILAERNPDAHYAERIVATGFLALSRRYATGPYEFWHLTLEDSIETTGRALLGLTLRCARCHDHKFDPTTTADYYALYGIFASTKYPFPGSEEFQSRSVPRSDFVPLVPVAEAQPRIEAYQRKLDALQKQIQALDEEKKEANKPRIDQLRAEQTRLRRNGLPPDLPAACAVRDDKPADAAIHLGGDPGQPGPQVPRGVPAFLSNGQPLTIPEGHSGRLELAEWLTRDDHPLTWRVMANRIWQHHFSTGLVATPSNFGLRGAAPTHPQLLDFLARHLVKHDGSIKQMHRLIMLSKTYQLSSADHPANQAHDPSNRWVWRFGRRRLEAEAIRDAMMMVGGGLDLARPGPHPFPPIEQWHWSQHDPLKAVYPSSHRSVYLMTQRIQRHPFLGLFDGPDTNHSTSQRTSSTVPLQALYLMNNPFVHQQATGLARRLIDTSPEPAQRIEAAHQLAWGRQANGVECRRAETYIEQYTRQLRETGTAADQVELEAWTSFAKIMLTASEFFYVD